MNQKTLNTIAAPYTAAGQSEQADAIKAARWDAAWGPKPFGDGRAEGRQYADAADKPHPSSIAQVEVLPDVQARARFALGKRQEARAA